MKIAGLAVAAFAMLVAGSPAAANVGFGLSGAIEQCLQDSTDGDLGTLQVPLVRSGNRNGYIIAGYNSNTGSSTSALFGYSTGTAGYTRGVVGACESPGGKAVYGVSKATSGYTYGIYGQARSTSGRGVYGEATATSGSPVGVKGTSRASTGYGVVGYASHGSGLTGGVHGLAKSTQGKGVYGLADVSTGNALGVYGVSRSSSGAGVYGKASASSGSTTGTYGVATASSQGRGVYGWGALVGVVGDTSTASGYGVLSQGDCMVTGDLSVSGSKTGYVVDVVLNGGDEPLYPGELVEIVSYSEPVVGRIPVAVVRKTTTAESKAVLGPIDSAVAVTPNEDFAACPASERAPVPYHVKWTDGAIEPGAYGRVVTLGLYERISVDASYGPIYPGDLLVSSPTQGYAMASDDPKVGTVVGKALGGLESGIGQIPVFVSSR